MIGIKVHALGRVVEELETTREQKKFLPLMGATGVTDPDGLRRDAMLKTAKVQHFYFDILSLNLNLQKIILDHQKIILCKLKSQHS